MYNGNPYNAYKQNTVKMASKEQLLLMLVDGAVGFVTGYAGNNGASYGNTAGIKAVTKRAQKRIVSSGLKKGISYYTKNAHNKGGTFGLTSLKNSLKKTAVGNAILAIKNRISSLFTRR